MTESEISLILKAKKGEEQAFGELYELYFDKIFKFIYYRVSHKEVAEDLTEDVFIKAWTSIKTVKENSFSGWLYQIAKNKVIDYYRQKKATVDIEEIQNILESDENLSENTNTIIEKRVFMEALKQLTPEQQIIIKLKFIEDLDNSEISDLISKSEGSIRVVQHRAILKLQELIKKQTK
ncbi:MAG: polymerase ECF-type sigma factor, polymerase sigma-70 factor, subfamily [Candidatus Doudnabacteria bacterium]|nr:polymerase ECF-type sigma factor, polymerase sigma-70 factor, subfamily [Candidatus Doudnabacteria bacterium]